MVSKLLKVCFKLTLSLLLLSTVINGSFDALQKKLYKMAAKGKKIDELFVPSIRGTIKTGTYGLVFKGTKVGDGQVVALKFVEVKDREMADHEFRIYGYLNAINQTHVNKFGIPTLYYYNEWDGYMLTVLSFFDGGDLDDLSLEGYFRHRNASLAINSFLLFRDFVIQSKYMHSRGVRHDDIKPGNIVVQGRRSYIIDFNSASKMTEERRAGTLKFLPRRIYSNEPRTAKSDWESFLYTMAYINRIEFGWFFWNPYPDRGLSDLEVDARIGREMKSNTDYIMRKISDASIESPALKHVFQKFATAALYHQHLLLPYDAMLRTIESAMDGKLDQSGHYKVFTWLKDDARRTASLDCDDVEIQNINVPEDFTEFQYVEYTLDYFPKPIPRKRSFSFCGVGSSSGSRK